MVTETNDVARALDDAALAWPELRDDRSALLRRLVEAGWATIRIEGGIAALVRSTAGVATGLYRQDEHARQLDEWPE